MVAALGSTILLFSVVNTKLSIETTSAASAQSTSAQKQGRAELFTFGEKRTESRRETNARAIIVREVRRCTFAEKTTGGRECWHANGEGESLPLAAAARGGSRSPEAKTDHPPRALRHCRGYSDFTTCLQRS